MSTPMPYVALQEMRDEDAVWGTRAYGKGLYLDELSDSTIDILAGRLAGRQSPLSQVLIIPMGGAFAEVPDDATAFGGARSLRYVLAIECHATDQETFAHDWRWVRDTWGALLPSAVHSGGYINLSADVEGESLRATYGQAKYDRLRRIKAQYDPENVFRHNANIPPAV